jgi:hypothetical protein
MERKWSGGRRIGVANVTTSSLVRMGGMGVHGGREKWKLSSSLTHDQQETRSIDAEVVVHRIRILREVTENREPRSHVSLRWERKWSPRGAGSGKISMKIALRGS